MFTLQFAQTRKARNSTLIPEMGESCQCYLKENTSIIRPTFKIHLGQGGAPATLEILAKENYCYCPNFQRYYYITNITSETAVIVYVQCEVDVLATFKEDILATPAFVMYSNSHFNSLIPDGRLPMLGTSRQWCNTTPCVVLDSNGSFAVTGVSTNASGNLGSAATLALAGSQLSTLASKMYSDDFWDNIKNDFYHPEEALLGCMWTPINIAQAGGTGAATISIGKYDLYTAIESKRTVTATIIANFKIPYTASEGNGNLGDYRNFEPYTKYELTLPGVGTIDLPMKLIAGNALTAIGNLPVAIEMAASPVTGDVTYNIKLMDASGGISGNAVAYTVKGNFGVEIPIARSLGRFGSIMQSLGGAAAAMAVGASVGGGLGLAIGVSQFMAQAVSSSIESMNVNTNIVGSLGGWSVNPAFNYTVEAKTINWDISDEPNAIRPTIGRPYYHHVSSLGQCSGIVQCTGAYVKTWATEEELQMISQYVNSSTNYLYGGVIIE